MRPLMRSASTLEAAALGARDDAVGLGVAFGAVQADLAVDETARFRPRQLARTDALRNALALVVFARSEPGRAGEGRRGGGVSRARQSS